MVYEIITITAYFILAPFGTWGLLRLREKFMGREFEKKDKLFISFVLSPLAMLLYFLILYFGEDAVDGVYRFFRR
jgi:hypothetical protein